MSQNNYGPYSIYNFRRHAGYKQISAQFIQHFGKFDEKWIHRIQYRQHEQNHYFQINVKFVPFLMDVDLEAHYYG